MTMTNGKWQTANVSIRVVMVGLMGLLMMGHLEAGESLAVLELFTSQG